MLSILATEALGPEVTPTGWFLENVWIIPAIMAVSFMIILFFGKRMPRGGDEVGITAIGISWVFAVLTGIQWISRRDNPMPDEHGGDLEQAFGQSLELAVEAGEGGGNALSAVTRSFTWWSNGGVDFPIGIFVDGLTVTLLFVVTSISLLVHIYSTDYVAGDRRYTHFFAFLSLFTAAMLFFVISQNIIQIIVGWELVGVCSFALIGHWWEEQPNSDAALKAFLTNRVGDVGLLIGMIILFWQAGSFDIDVINRAAIDGEIGQGILLVACLCLMTAVMSKSGQFALHTWLPDAMAGPTPVSALIHAATMVVAGVYMIARLYGVFWEGFDIAGSNINAMALIGAITLVFGGLLAFVQDDIKKVLAYSTVSQLGYMVMALGVGAWTAAIFHLFTHAFFKAGLFLGAGSVSHSVHSFDMKTSMGGMKKYMPTTFWTFLICTISLVGVFPFAGFWSKDEILVGTGGWPDTNANGEYYLMIGMGILGAALTGAYMTRVIYLTFFGEFRGDLSHGEPQESGKRITVPLIILSVMGFGAGFLNFPPGFQLVPDAWHERFFHYVEPTGGYFPVIAHGKPSWSLAIFSSAIGLTGVALAYRYYFVKVKAQSPAATELARGLTSRNKFAKFGHEALVHKYYLDHLYTTVITGFVKGPAAKFADWSNKNVLDRTVDEVGKGAVKAGTFVYEQVDQRVIDGAVNLSGAASSATGGELRKVQTGKVQQYAAIMFGAATLLAGIFIVFV